MGNVVGCGPDQVRFSFCMDDGIERFWSFTVTEYDGGIVYLDGNGTTLSEAPYVAEAFLNSTTSIGTAKRILGLGKKETVKAVCIEVARGEKLIRILVPKDEGIKLSIEA